MLKTSSFTRSKLSIVIGALFVSSTFVGNVIAAQNQLQTQVEHQQQIEINQVAGKLKSSLNKLAAKTKIVLSFKPELVDGLSAKAVDGRYNIQQAFTILLAETNLELRYDRGVYYILPKSYSGKLPDMTVTSTEIIQVYGKQLGYHERNGSTAMRQNISLLKTPQSIFVINDELIKDQQSYRIDQVLQNDSSVQKANNFLGAYSSFQIRGFRLDNASNYLRNGRPFFHLASPPVEILERIEVLKGPSSVLYGTMAPGGIINMATKRAASVDFKGAIKATVGSDDLKHLHVDLAGALNEEGSLRYRVNLVKEKSNSYRKFFDGSDFDVDRQVISLNLEYDIDSDTVIRVDLDNTSDDRPQDAGLIAGADGKPASDKAIIFTQPWSNYNSDVSNTAVEVEHFFNDDWSVKTGINYQGYERDRYDQQYRGFDTATANLAVRTRHRINRWDYLNAFIDVSGNVKLAGIEHQLLFGVETTQIDVDNNETSRNENYVTNIFNPIAIEDPQIAVKDENDVGDTTKNAIFVQDLIHLNDELSLLLGLRYDKFETFFKQAGKDPRSDYSVDNLTPRIGAVYSPSGNQSWYASYSESFEPNSPVGGGFENVGDELDPTLGAMYEIGYKWESDEGDLLFSSAIFDIERSNVPFETIDNRIEQRGVQRHKGAEIALKGLIGNVSLTGSMTYLDAEFIEDDNPNLVGNTPVSVPDFSASIWAEYQLAQYISGLSLQAGWRYETKRPIDNANTFELDAFHKVDIGAKYEQLIGDKNPLVYRITVSNLFDETYYKSSNANDLNWEPPRQIRASIEYSF
jgi:iron complex outermembrane receptor protein